MKIGFIIFICIALTVLFGAVPLHILGEAFTWLGWLFKKLAEWLDIFGWRGVL